MAKKRSCRRTDDENVIHNKAVKMRKMTDEQLVHYFEEREEWADREGYNRGKKDGNNDSISKFISELSKVSGIGAATISKIKALAVERGYIQSE